MTMKPHTRHPFGSSLSRTLRTVRNPVLDKLEPNGRKRVSPTPRTPFGSGLSGTSPAPQEQGFSLIEALVALLILGVAAAGLVRAVESHIDSIARLEQRAAAIWVAENRLTELTLADPGTDAGTVDMLGRRWQVRTTMRTSPDPNLSRVDVAVGPPGGTALVTIGGFVDRGPKIAPLPVPQS